MLRADQSKKRRATILAVGLDLFIRKGFHSTKIKDIATEANMSTGLLFHYFASKDKLYEELLTIGLSGPQFVFSDVHGEPLAFFETAITLIFSYLAGDPFVAKMFVLMTRAELDESTPAAIKESLVNIKTIPLSAALIEQGQKNGTIRAGDATALAIAFWGAVSGIAEQLALNARLPCPKPEWIVDILRKRDIS